MKLRPLPISLALTALASPGGWAQSATPAVAPDQPARAAGGTVDVSLQAADAATISRVLGEALGGTVRLEGAVAAPVTLDLQGAPARAALDAVARALHGDWRPIYTVTAGAAPAAVHRPVPLGRIVSANLERVSARAALALVARAGGGTLELPAELSKSVTLDAKEMPVEQALDELARQADASWSVTYVIKAGLAPPPPAPSPTPASARSRAPRSNASPTLGRPATGRGGAPAQPEGNPQGLPFNDRRFIPTPFTPQPQTSPAAPGPDSNAAKLLGDGLTRVMQMPPAQRRSAVRDFALQLDQQFRQIQALPAPRRAGQMAAMRPIYQAATRTYTGLTPDQRQQFQPIVDVFNRWMR